MRAKGPPGLQRNPPGSGLLRAHFTRGKQLGLAKFGEVGEARVCQDRDFPASPDMQTRPSRRVFALWVLVSRPRANGAVRAADSARPASVAQSAAARKSDRPVIREKRCRIVTRRAVAVAVSGRNLFFRPTRSKATRAMFNARTEGGLFHDLGRSRSGLP